MNENLSIVILSRKSKGMTQALVALLLVFEPSYQGTCRTIIFSLREGSHTCFFTSFLSHQFERMLMFPIFRQSEDVVPTVFVAHFYAPRVIKAHARMDRVSLETVCYCPPSAHCPKHHTPSCPWDLQLSCVRVFLPQSTPADGKALSWNLYRASSKYTCSELEGTHPCGLLVAASVAQRFCARDAKRGCGISPTYYVTVC